MQVPSHSTGFAQPNNLCTAGSIKVAGRDIKDITLASLRGQIAAVPQDLTLFNDTVFYNIAYGRQGATEDEIFRAARRAAIDEQACCPPVLTPCRPELRPPACCRFKLEVCSPLADCLEHLLHWKGHSCFALQSSPVPLRLAESLRAVTAVNDWLSACCPGCRCAACPRAMTRWWVSAA